ncbi:MAG: MerR family transcriptional regulator [Gammaproteobacteria bacterium]|nr:MAG: MerR family transcriptional regulator [Gammaproteobacteria bacterium]
MKEVHIGVVLEHSGPFTLEELCHACGLPRALVIELVEHGVLEPQGLEPERWRFSGLELGRTRRALRLQQDLELNTAALSLTLELLDEVHYLRRRVKDLETLLGR